MRKVRSYTTGNPEADARIERLAAAFTDDFDRTLLTEMFVSVYRLGTEKASTIDLKILNSTLKELRYAFGVFSPYRHLKKVAIFGSARTPRGHADYAAARKFGLLMRKAGWMVITGGASGIMRAGHEGAGAEASFGLNIRLPFEQEANTVIARDAKLINCKYFFTRKLLFIKESHATVLFPGGFGTLDEGFECLTLVQTGKTAPRPVVLVESPGGRFWEPLLRFVEKNLVGGGMVDPEEAALIRVARSPEEAAEAVLDFYRVYHSMRYVGGRLVIRLKHPLPQAAVERLNSEFADLLSSGRIRPSGALPEELEEQGDEPELKELPRLVLRFDRRHYGRLIQMIARLNRLVPKRGKIERGQAPFGRVRPKSA